MSKHKRGKTGPGQGVPRPNRKSIRLPGYDYSQPGAYYVTICIQDRICLLGNIVERKMVLNDAGRMVGKWFVELENKFPDIKCDQYVVMPNHFHAIIQNIGANPVGANPVHANPVGADLRVCPSGENMSGEHVSGENMSGEHVSGEKIEGEHVGSPLPRVIQWFKTMTTNEYIRGVKKHQWPRFPGKLWQRNYYEHVIRNENETNRIRKYITDNPAQWSTDRENPLSKTLVRTP